VCNPTTGSPTITLFQLRSNYHAGLEEQSIKKSLINLNINQLTAIKNRAPFRVDYPIYERYGFSSVMGGVCKV